MTFIDANRIWDRARVKSPQPKPKKLTPEMLARAIRIAAKMAGEQPNPNPYFVEALEVAATYFDEGGPFKKRQGEPVDRDEPKRQGRRRHTRRAERNARRCAMATCCGKTFPAGFRAKHEAGLLHQQYPRISALLAQQCLTDTEIAKRIGCSKQYVQQIVKQIGAKSASERSTACVIDHSRSRALAHPLVSAFVAAAESNAVRCDLLQQNCHKKRFFHNKLTANGYTVRLRKTKYNRLGYVILHNQKGREEFDFIAYLLQNTREWMIVPWAARPMNQTMFAVEPNLDAIGMVTDNRHDWPQYLNAWHLLAEKKSA